LDTSVPELTAQNGFYGFSPWENPPGTAVAKDFPMLTLSAFVIAIGSVFGSVVWACKEDLTTSV